MGQPTTAKPTRKVTLLRRAYMAFGTFGELLIASPNGNVRLVTVERPWESNRKFLSCIPEGVYICRKRISGRFGITYEVTQVPGRSHILFHVGNRPEDFQGCIGLGMRFGYVDGVWAVRESRLAINEFKEAIFSETFTLKLKQYTPTSGETQ